jgi:HK97 family phage prohead protease
MDLKFKTFDFEAKANAEGSQFEGLVSVFHNVDSYGEIVTDTAFDQDLPEFMRTGFIGGLNHDWDSPIGTPQPGTKVTDKGLFLVGNVIDTAHGADVRKMLKAGVVKKLSIGYRLLGHEVLETYDDVLAYWEGKKYTPSAQDVARAAQGNIWVLTRIRLYEGSPVTVPANDAADITAVRMRAFKAMQECIGEGCSCNKGHEKPDTDALHTQAREDWQANKLRLAAFASSRLAGFESNKGHAADPPESAELTDLSNPTVRELEKLLRDAGLSHTVSRRFISMAKTLPRDAASEDAGTTQTEPDEAEPVASETQAAIEAEAEETAPTTTVEGTTEELVAADVPPEPEAPKFELPTGAAAVVFVQQQRTVGKLHQQFLELEARRGRWLQQ